MADRREFIKLDIGYLANPKIAGLLAARRPLAVLLHIECITYSRQHRTDGVVPAALALRGVVGATKRDLAAAVDAGLLTDLGDGTVLVHDYLKHQESAAKIAEKSEKASEAAGIRWHGAARNAKRTPRRNADRYAEERRGEEKEEAIASSAPDAASGADPARRRKPERPLPETWAPTDRHADYATEHRLDLNREAEAFRAHAATHDRRARDWDAAFRMWLTKAVERRPAKAAPRLVPGQVSPGDQLPW